MLNAAKLCVLALAVFVVACTADSPSEPPPTSGPPTVSRLWQIFVADRNNNWSELGADRTQNDGLVYDSITFGDVALIPRVFTNASASVFSSETGQSYFVKGVAPHVGLPASNTRTGSGMLLYQESRYVVDTNPSLSYTLSAIELDAIDGDPAPPSAAQCRQNPPVDVFHCAPVRSVVRFRLAAHAGTRELLNVQGSVRLQGRGGVWDFDVWTEDGDVPAFTRADFLFDPDFDDSKTFEFGAVFLDAEGGIPPNKNAFIPIVYRIPLGGTKRGDTIVVNVQATALASDSRQSETSAAAYLRDPANASGVTAVASGLHLVAPPHPPTIDEIKGVPHSAPSCTATPGTGGSLQFANSHFTTSEGEFPGALIEVTRTGSTSGLVSAVVTTTGGSATSGDDYDPVTRVVRFGDGQGGSRMVPIPIHGDATKEPDETIGLALSGVGGCATLGGQTTATLTIQDDDNQTAPAQFSIAGTVSGLVGSGLVLRDRIGGFEVRPTTNGSFTIVPATLDGSQYAVEVQAQPSNPLQVCTVANGSGTIAHANVANVAVTCTTPAPTGSLDASFGTGGRATSALPSGATAIALHSDGKIVAVGDSKVQRFNPDGTLDSSFGTAGQADFVFPNATGNLPQAVAIQPDGKIVVVGYITELSRQDCVVARYNSNGSLDASFTPAGGKSIVDLGAAFARGTGVALQSDGSIVIAGQVVTQRGAIFDGDFVAARLTTAGLLDASFGTAGKTSINIAGTADAANAVAIQSDGKIVLAGHAGVDGGSNGNIGIVRLTASGSVDSTFGANGIVSSTLGLGDVTREAFDLALQPDGRILITGEVQVSGVLNVLLARFTADGALDATFGTGGVTTTAVTSEGDAAKAIALQADGKIVVAGRTALFGTSDFGLARYSAGGVLDPSFGTGGKVTIDFLSGNDGAEAVLVQPDGKIVAAGFARNGNSIGLGMVRVIP